MAANQSPRRVIEVNFRVGEWLVEPRNNRITRNGDSRKVEPKVMDMLVCLARQAGETVTREQLLETLWADTFVTEDALNRSISKLRKLFDDDPKNPSFIETIPKIGYRLIAPASIERGEATPAKSILESATNGAASQDFIINAPQQTEVVQPSTELFSAPDAKRSQSRLLRNGLYVALGLAFVAGVFALAWKLFKAPISETASTAIRIVPLTSIPGHEIYPSFSPDASRISFAWSGEARDNWDIYVKQIGVETLLRLTSHPARDNNPAWSPDGRTIAFVRTLETEKAIYTVSAIGGAERKLASCNPASEPDISWTADSRKLAFTDRASAQSPHTVFLLDLDSLERKPLTTPPENHVGDGDLAFSPDGRTLAFARSSALGVEDIYLLSIGSGEIKRITFDNLKIHGLAWTPDSKRIIYSSNRGGSFTLWQISIEGGAPELAAAGGASADEPALSPNGNLLAYERWTSDTNIWQMSLTKPYRVALAPVIASTQWDWNPHYSPDGNRIAFISDRSGTAEVWTCESGGQNCVKLTSFNGPYTSAPRWSPDSRRIAFDTPADGNFDIYIVDVEGGGLRRITSEQSEERAASWSRDGRWIYFASNRSGAWQVWKAPSEGGAAIQVTRHEGFAAFESLDGQWIYFTKQDAAGLWRMPASGGDESLIVSRLSPVDWSNWAIARDGIYFVDRAVPDRPELVFFDSSSGNIATLAPLPRFLYKSGIALSPDHKTLLYTQIDRSEADLMLVENFR